MRSNIIKLCACAVSMVLEFTKGNEFAYMQPSKPTTIFQPFGKIINQYTYANIRVHININSLFDEVQQLCYTEMIEKNFYSVDVA